MAKSGEKLFNEEERRHRSLPRPNVMLLDDTILDSKIATGGQSSVLTQLYCRHGEKLRIRIKSDTYSHQCLAICDIYSPKNRSWSMLVYIDPAQMKTEKGLSYNPDAPTEYNFQNDINELLRLANLILA